MRIENFSAPWYRALSMEARLLFLELCNAQHGWTPLLPLHLERVSPGLLRECPQSLAEKTGNDIDSIRGALRELHTAQVVEVDWPARLIRLLRD